MMLLPPLLPPVPIWGRRICALAGLALLVGCANDDFGRVNSTLVRDEVHDWVAAAAIAGKKTSTSSYELTDDERELRDLAYPLIEPAYDRNKWYSVAGEYGITGAVQRNAFNRTAYSDHLFGDRYRSPSARYARLTDDVRNDTTRLPQFFETAARVIDTDQKRRKSMAYVSGLSTDERNRALRRIYENAQIVSLVREKLVQRVSSYRFALERLVIMTPSRQAVEVELALNHLQADIARYRGPGPPTWMREKSLADAR